MKGEGHACDVETDERLITARIGAEGGMLTAVDRSAAFCDRHLRPFRWLLRVQSLVSRVNPTPAMTPALRLMDHQRFIDWSFGHYLRIAPPGFALEGDLPPVEAAPVAAAAA